MIEPSLLLHIGPHKTGTTAVQGAFHAGRAWLGRYGVRYAGPTRQPFRAVLARVGSPGPFGQPFPDQALWDELVEELTTAPDDRVVVSSEAFSGADDETVREIVAEISGARRLHVVVTLRPLTLITPSQWQQMVQNGLALRYERWLTRVFNDDDDRTITPTFWRRHDHAALIARWVGCVGAENVTMVVVDDAAPGATLRHFEQLLDLPVGVLETPEQLTNRSLTLPEVELIRRINVAAAKAGWPRRYYGKALHAGAIAAMKQRAPKPTEPRIATPSWALERAALVGEQTVALIRSTGVNVLGDLSRLTEVPDNPDLSPEGEEAPPKEVPMAAAVRAVIGAVGGLSTLYGETALAPPTDADDPDESE